MRGVKWCRVVDTRINERGRRPIRDGFGTRNVQRYPLVLYERCLCSEILFSMQLYLLNAIFNKADLKKHDLEALYSIFVLISRIEVVPTVTYIDM